MSRTLYVTFTDGAHAEKAAGALLDFGARQEDLSILVDYDNADSNATDAEAIDKTAKVGLSTTTPEDAGAGAAKGAGIGLGVGVLAGLASILVPGVGLVFGAGALATAIAAAAGTAAAGAIAGGVTGYLKDQGVNSESALAYEETLEEGGALLTIVVPSGKLDEITAVEIVRKYGADDIDLQDTVVDAATLQPYPLGSASLTLN